MDLEAAIKQIQEDLREIKDSLGLTAQKSPAPSNLVLDGEMSIARLVELRMKHGKQVLKDYNARQR